MAHHPRTITFLRRDGRLKHYGIAVEDRPPDETLAASTGRVAGEVVPADGFGFTIAHEAATAGLGLVYWWANDNEIHHRVFASPLDDLGRLEAADGTGMACVWELEVIDFERRAWLADVLREEDTDAYLERALEPVRV